ncbi:hypothetical protein ACRAKI_31810 [Saccharothrix isguenensis]
MADLLGDLDALRRRARKDRHAYPFPLLFFGIASFLAIPLYQPWGPEALDWGYTARWDPLPSLGTGHAMRYPMALGLYWLTVLVVGALVTAWWYRRRGRRVGIETSTGGYLAAVAIGVGSPLVSETMHRYVPMSKWGQLQQGPATAVGLMLIAAATVLWRWKAPRALTAVMAVLGTATLQYAQGWVGQFIVIGLGLVVLAAVERSTRFTTTTAGYLVAVCLSAGFTPVRDGPATLWSMASVVLLPGFVLVVGGLVGLRRE